MSRPADPECCPPFDPKPWEDRLLVWEGKRFVKDRVIAFLHIPLNFGSVMRRNFGPISAANAFPNPPVVLSDDTSLWGSDVYIETTKEIPGATMATLSGTFLSKVFEGPYKNAGTWAKQMAEFVGSEGRSLKKLYFYYTTCPACAKKYGKNYVVLLAQV